MLVCEGVKVGGSLVYVRACVCVCVCVRACVRACVRVCTVVTLGTRKICCYRKEVCIHRLNCTLWTLMELGNLSAIEVFCQYSGHCTYTGNTVLDYVLLSIAEKTVVPE